jgi:hypothetical protein
MTDDANITPDEALEETNDQDYDSDVGYKEILPEDNDRPFQPADNPNAANVPKDHPITDSNVDLHEQYDEGVSTASGYDDKEDQLDQANL